MEVVPTPAAIAFSEDPPRHAPESADSLLLNIEGYEGPIDVLLELARHQKVDLTKISILELVRQYLAFIERAAQLDLELAAEYLVMAAWLAYLKSRLLLPKTSEEEAQPDAQDIALALQFQLRRLEAMQNAAKALMNRPLLGQSVFARGAPEGLATRTQAQWTASLYDLLKTFGEMKRRQQESRYELPIFSLMSAEDAFARLTRMLGELPRPDGQALWTTLENFLPAGLSTILFARSALASTFTAGLELARQGKVELRQDSAFKPIYLRPRPDTSEQ
jgi:segregation and condensation protein A